MPSFILTKSEVSSVTLISQKMNMKLKIILFFLPLVIIGECSKVTTEKPLKNSSGTKQSVKKTQKPKTNAKFIFGRIPPGRFEYPGNDSNLKT